LNGLVKECEIIPVDVDLDRLLPILHHQADDAGARFIGVVNLVRSNDEPMRRMTNASDPP
jgi:hypothetical protein